MPLALPVLWLQVGDNEPRERHSQNLEWKSNDAVFHVLGPSSLGDEFQIFDCYPNRDLELVCVNQPGEISAISQPMRGDTEKIAVETEKDAAKLSCSCQQ